MKKFLKVLSTIISVLFHPLWSPLLIFIIFKQLTSEFGVITNYSNSILCQFLIFVIVGPLLSILGIIVINRKKFWATLMMEKKEERNLPYAFLSLYYLVSIYQLNQRVTHHLLIQAMAGAFLSLMILLLLNRTSKISAHMVGIAGTVGAISGFFTEYQVINYYWLFLFIGFVGIVGSARLYLKTHVPYQIYVGAFIGFTVEYIMVSKQLFPVDWL